MEYSLSKEELLKIVSSCQQRSYAEEVDLLQEKGDSVGWIFDGLGSDEKDGISNHEP